MPRRSKKNSLHKDNTNVDVSDTSKLVEEEFEEGNIRRILPPEEKYVRRSAKAFKEGAEPVIGRGSHRLVDHKVSLTPELLSVAKAAAKHSDVPFTVWARAAFRKAIRDSMDAGYELETEVEIPLALTEIHNKSPK